VKIVLALIIIVYLGIGGLFATRTPAWQAPDEPAHYNYIAQVANAGCCPIIAAGDWDSAYLDQLKSARFAPETLSAIETVQYEDHQPPLYYLLLSPIYRLTDGDLIALRIASLLFGVIIIIAAYGAAIALLPDRPEIALAVAAFVAFQPQHLAILASVNNDGFAWALVSVILWLSIVYVKQDHEVHDDDPPRRLVPTWALGLLVGIGFLTKATVYMMAAIVVLALIARWAHKTFLAFYSWRGRDQERHRFPILREAIVLFVPMLGLGLLWWGRNIAVYGFPDFLGLAAHDAVVVGQPRTADLIASVGFGEYLRLGMETTFGSFWGNFGWMGLPLVGDPAVAWIYPVIGALIGFAVIGLLIDVVYLRRRDAIDTSIEQIGAWILVISTAILGVLAFLYYNTEFQQFQGRYMFTILIPVGIAFALGIDAWRRLFYSPPHVLSASTPDSPPHTWGGARGGVGVRWIVVIVFCLFALLDLYLIWRVIPPNLAPL
jgi:hypothetical protein